MLVEIIAKITAEIDFNPDSVINYDTIGDYKAEMDCELVNKAGDRIKYDGKWEEIEILSATPCDTGIDEYGMYLNNYHREYEIQTREFNEKFDKIKKG